VNWGLILQLSLFGLVMAFATVFIVPSNVEPLVWLVIFVICAFLIAKRAPGKVFLHGLLLGVANSVWITGVHVALFDQYLAHHAREAAMMKTMTVPIPPRLLMACVGPIVGVVSGVIIGLFAVVVGLIARPKSSAPGRLTPAP
jgi:hypothetical protein